MAVERIADTPRFTRPLPIRRWERYGDRIIAACQERAMNDAIHTDGSWQSVFRRVTIDAIHLTAIEVNVPRTSIMVTVDGKRLTVRGDRNITPWEVLGQLPMEFYFNWFRTSVANEVMDNLLPNWRSEEQRSRERLQFMSLDSLVGEITRQFSDNPSLFSDPLIAQDAATKAGYDAMIAQDSAEMFLHKLLPLLTPQERVGLQEYGNGSGTIDSVARALGKDRSTVSRQFKSITKKARRLRDAQMGA